MNACMTPDSLSMLLARDTEPDSEPVSSVAPPRCPPARAVVAPFDLPKVIVSITLDDEIATLPRGIPSPVRMPESTPTPTRSLRGLLTRISATLLVGGAAVVLLASPAPFRVARSQPIVDVVTHAGHAAAGWAGALRAVARR